MESQQNIHGRIWEILYESDEHALSAQDVADELGDYSRQYVDRQLRRMAKQQDNVGRVEIGPSVGYYWNYDAIDMLDSTFEDWGLMRPTVENPLPVPCMGCDQQLTEDDQVVVVFERPKHLWEMVQTACTDCLEDEHLEGLIQASLTERYVSDAIEDVEMPLVAVHGSLVEQSFEDQNSGRELVEYRIQDTTVLQLIRPPEFSVVPEFSLSE